MKNTHHTGRQFRVQGMAGVETTISILGENRSSYTILMVSTTPYGTSESEETLTKELFESCIRTGYLEEIHEPVLTSA
ncbi:hypothetical protein [Spirochaeta lutea]|uniref:Uncharacterized protein n=1 Tax=Spirochaeta lutea TaxID=1480694 RepID=A0A098QVH8_9SPIO|nr:hypothetical protein [Spirochaeta lutea]KGE71596.1 hypothetical protein DC28_09975 [Spirochaeta lutea]